LGTIGQIPDTLPVTHGKVSIGDPMISTTDSKVSIEAYRHWLPLVTECPRLNFNHFLLLCNEWNLSIVGRCMMKDK
jgi:hypothetical protein